MDNVLLVAYLLIVLAMIAVILVQRSEGGGLGMGGGTNSFMTAKGSANVLTRTTAILATLFFVLAIGLTVVKSINKGSTAILDSATQQTQQTTGTDKTGTTQTTQPKNVLDALNKLQEQTSGAATTTNTAPATTSNTAPASTSSSAPATTTDTPALAVPDSSSSTGTSGK